MKLRIAGLTAGIFLAFSAWGQALPAGRALDLDFVANQVPRLHPNFFFQLDPAVFQQAVSNLEANGAAMTDAEFYNGLAGLLAMAGDGHTLLYLTNQQAVALGWQQFPLTFRWLDDGLYVVAAAAPYARALGTRVAGVGSYPIGDAVESLAAVISHGNDQWLHYFLPQYLRVQRVLQGLHLASPASTTSFTFETGSGDAFSLDLSPGTLAQSGFPDPSQGPLPDYLQNTSRNYWFSYSAANRLLYFKYNVCEDDPANPMAQFSQTLLAVVDANPVDSLVFDLRGNTGGDDSVIEPLALGLLERAPALAAKPQFRIYDVIDKGTFSSGVDLAMGLKIPPPPEYGLTDESKLVTAIGEGTGGPTAGYGEVQSFTLPASRLQGQYSTKYFPAPDGIPAGPSFLPDIAISTRSTDYFARHDPVMAAILTRSKGAPPAPQGSAIVVNGASFRADQGVAPASLAAVFGSFGVAPDQVLIDGAAGELIASNPNQANFRVPAAAAVGSRPVSVRAAGVELAAGTVTISPAGPGIFVLNSADPTQPGAVENQDSTINAGGNPAAAGSVVQIFATGAAPSDPTVSVYIGEVPADVLYSGPSGYPGLWQLNARVPAGISGEAAVFLASQGYVSNAVTVWVR